MKRLGLLFILFGTLLLAQPNTINISGPIYSLNGVLWSGYINVTGPAITSCFGVPITSYSYRYTFHNGQSDTAINLLAINSCPEGSYLYNVSYLDNQGTYTSGITWAINNTPLTQTISQIQSPIGLSTISSPRNSIKNYGAKCDGVTDDTSAITSALISSVGELYFPPGTCIFMPSHTGYGAIINANTMIYGDGDVSVIKIANGSPAFWAAFQTTGTTSIQNIKFDMNLSGNPHTSPSDSLAYPRILINVGHYPSFIMDHVTVYDANDINVIYSGASDVSITNCSFLNIGGDPNNYSDHSTIYLHGEKAFVTNNLFEGHAINALGAGTAIETHGGLMTITGNVVNNMGNGMNITGVAITDSDTITVTSNVLNGVNYGISLWSYKYQTHTTGYGIDGAIISNNVIRVKWLSYPDAVGSFGGIDIYPGGTLPVRNMLIKNNIIDFDFDDGSRLPINAISAGISYWDLANAGFDNIVIEGNTITNSPESGVRWIAAGSNLMVRGNQIVNPGSCVPGNCNPAYQIGLLFGGGPVTNLKVLDNNIVDNLATTRMTSGIYSYSSNTGDFIVRNNNIAVLGSTTTAFINAYSLTSSTQLPLIQDVVNTPVLKTFPTYKVASGSTIYSMVAGKLYQVGSDGLTWTSPSDIIYAPLVKYNGSISSDSVAGYGSLENQIIYSEQFDNAAWGKSHSTVTANSTTAPNGFNTADTLVEDNAVGTIVHYIGLSTTLTGGAYTYSVYAKTNGDDIDLNVIGTHYAYFDLHAGTVGITYPGDTATIANVGNGWYRCTLSIPSLSAGATPFYIYTVKPPAILGYTGDGVSGIYLWGAQINSTINPFAYSQTVASPLILTPQVVFGNAFSIGKILNGGAATKIVCWKSDGKTLGYATMAAGDISSCN